MSSAISRCRATRRGSGGWSNRHGQTGAGSVTGCASTVPRSAPMRRAHRSRLGWNVPVTIRPARAEDAEAIAAIYNQGIEERQATFQTRLHRPGELEEKVAGRGGRVLVAESDGALAGFASWAAYDDPAPYYTGVGECAVYVAPGARRAGAGSALLEGLASEAEAAGLCKLVAKIFTSNESSVALFRRCGFREVGVHLRHGRLDGRWKDVLVMERLLGPAAA